MLAGSDTTSNSLSRIIATLAEHPKHQVKLRHELLEARTSRESASHAISKILTLPSFDLFDDCCVRIV